METLIHTAKGELITNDPFKVIGNRFEYTQIGLDHSGKIGGYTYIVTKDSLDYASKMSARTSFAGLEIELAPGRGVVHKVRLIRKDWLKQVSEKGPKSSR